MEIIREKLSVPVSKKISSDLWVELEKSYNPIIHAVRGGLRRKVGLDYIDKLAFYSGDIFFTDVGQMLFYRILDDRKAVEIGTILREDNEREVYSEFKGKVENSVLMGSKVEWKDLEEVNKQFELIREETNILRVDKQEIEAAFEIKDDNLRNLLKQVNSKGTCFQEELMSGENDYETVSHLAQLENLGLITKEFFIFCRKTEQQISRINSLTALEEARAHGFKCFNCGRLISEEKISPQIKCSPLGERFSKANYWLALHLVYVLEILGVSIEDICYKTENNNKVFDLFVGAMNEFFLIEVKDEPIRLEEVFMFLTRVNFFKPFRAILVSSHPVPMDVRMYLKNFKGASPLTLVEGLDELKYYVADCFQNTKEVYQERFFKEFSLETQTDVLELLNEKFLSKIEAELMAMEEAKIKAKRKEMEEDLLLKGEFEEVIPGEDMEEISPVTEEIPKVMETIEIGAEITAEISAEEIEKMEVVEMEVSAEEKAGEGITETRAVEAVAIAGEEKQKEETGKEFVM